jgi:hypothetical protein
MHCSYKMGVVMQDDRLCTLLLLRSTTAVNLCTQFG